MLGIYEEALVRFFSQIEWRNKIPVVYAGSDRAHGTVAKWLKINRNIETSQLGGALPIPYPFAAVWRSRFTDDIPRRSMYHHRGFCKDIENGIAMTMRTPKSVVCDFDVNFYFDDELQMENIEWQIHNLFPDQVAWVTVDYKDPKWYEAPNERFTFAQVLGEQRIQLDLNNLVDSSSIEQSGLDQNEFRMTLSGNLHGYIPFQPYSRPIVKEVTFRVTEENSLESLSNFSKEFEED